MSIAKLVIALSINSYVSSVVCVVMNSAAHKMIDVEDLGYFHAAVMQANLGTWYDYFYHVIS